MILNTERLILRPWREEDLEPFAKMNADPRVMEFFPSTLSKEESDRIARDMKAKIEECGWGWWAVSLSATGEFIGFIGLRALEKSTFSAPFTPAVEVGWRLAHPHWGKGYATEGALACLKFGFESLNLPEIVAYTSLQNERSVAVMKKIGMHRNPAEDFDHPRIPEGQKMRRHQLYRLSREEWEKSGWLTRVKEGTAAEGEFFAKDKLGHQVILEWKKTDITSSALVEFKKDICEIACEALAPVEAEFLRANPESVNHEVFLMGCASLLKHDPVDWQSVKEKIASTIKQFYLIDLSSFGPDIIKPLLNDVYFLGTVKNSKTEKPLGFIMCSITPELPFGDIKVINASVAPAEQHRELDKLLMSSIFKIIPDVKRLFTFLRPTNEVGIKTYSGWGFTQNENGFQDPNHKVNQEYLKLFEYKSEKNHILQKIALESFR